jgi:hypothetical protein
MRQRGLIQAARLLNVLGVGGAHARCECPYSVDRPWREILKQQVVGKKKKPPRTNYSLKDYRIVISMNLPDLSSYQIAYDVDGKFFDCCVSCNKLVSIVSRFKTLSTKRKLTQSDQLLSHLFVTACSTQQPRRSLSPSAPISLTA